MIANKVLDPGDEESVGRSQDTAALVNRGAMLGAPVAARDSARCKGHSLLRNVSANAGAR